MEYALATMVIATIIFLFLRIRAQDAIIRDLNDRLMARSYTEYTAGRAREDPPAELKSRPPLSWYDDPTILDGDKE